jgi:hypothetical protein
MEFTVCLRAMSFLFCAVEKWDSKRNKTQYNIFLWWSITWLLDTKNAVSKNK